MEQEYICAALVSGLASVVFDTSFAGLLLLQDTSAITAIATKIEFFIFFVLIVLEIIL